MENRGTLFLSLGVPESEPSQESNVSEFWFFISVAKQTYFPNKVGERGNTGGKF